MSTEILQTPKLSTSRLLLLGAASVVLCLSSYMAMFTPFPIAMAVVLYGRVRSYGVALLGLLACSLVGFLFFGGPVFTASYAVLMLFAALIAEVTLRGWRPVRSMVITGGVVLSGLVAALWAYLQQRNIALESAVTEMVTYGLARFEEASKAGGPSLVSLGLARPIEELVQQIISTLPGYTIVGVFCLLWVNMYLVLKGRRLLQPALMHDHNEHALLGFKMPLAGVYAVVVGLALSVWGSELKQPWIDPVATTLLMTVGVFYFFQGLGVALNFLNHFQIMGFFRTLLVMAVVFFVPWVVALLGLFDTWFDFNQKFKEKVSN